MQVSPVKVRYICKRSTLNIKKNIFSWFYFYKYIL